VWDLIVSSPASTVLRPSDLHARSGANGREVREVVEAALTAGLIRPVYRIANESVSDPHARAWTAELLSLRRIWDTIDGAEVNGANPKEISIGFQRTKVNVSVRIPLGAPSPITFVEEKE
jgi:hypothetical protein